VNNEMVHNILLACGILAPLLYIGSDIVAAMSWKSYSYIDQSVSELRAIGAPTRPFLVPVLIIYSLLEIAFGWAVRNARGQKRGLRIAGILLIGLGLLDMVAPFFPMHLRGTGETMTDTLHKALTAVTVLLILSIIWFGSNGDGKGFRVYSIATIAVLVLFGALAGSDAGRIAANLPTPWVGVWERINIYGYMLWMAILAVMLIRVQDRAAMDDLGERSVSR
jgi:hypothetical protein